MQRDHSVCLKDIRDSIAKKQTCVKRTNKATLLKEVARILNSL